MQIESGGLRVVVTDYLPGERMTPHWHPVMQFFFRDERTPADSVNVSGTVFRRRPGI